MYQLALSVRRDRRGREAREMLLQRIPERRQQAVVEGVRTPPGLPVLDGSAFFAHLTGHGAIVCDEVDAVVSCYPPQPNRDCARVREIDGVEVTWVGDALAPRSVEEAILAGLNAAPAL